tara:strand:+ start:1415 stop:1873 length:459 start_codon:yes stop_codon:yes gene_type:complete
MISVFKAIFSAIIITTLVLAPGISHAGDVMPEGTVLTEESYVFTIDEATRLLQRVEELEAKEEKLNLYLELDLVRTQQLDLYRSSLDLSRQQINYYVDLQSIDQGLIDRYNRRARFQTLENVGFLTLGIALTFGAFLATDSINDHMRTNSAF